MFIKRLEPIIGRVIHVGVLAIFFLPLYLNSSFYFPFITPRNFAFRIIVEILFGLYLILLLTDWKKYSVGKSKIIGLMAVFFVWLTLASILNFDFWIGFWGNYERMDGLLNAYHLLAFLIILVGFYRHKDNWIQLFHVTFFVSFIVSFIALGQHSNLNLFIESSGGDRVSSTLGNAAYVGTYTLFNIFFGFFLLARYRHATDSFKLFGLWKIPVPAQPAGQRLRWELIAWYLLDVMVVIFEAMARGRGNAGTLTLIFTNAAIFWAFILPQLFLNLNVWTKKFRHYGAYGYYLSIILLNAIALFNTQTRGALIGLVAGLILMAVMALFMKSVPNFLRISGGIILVVIVLSIGLVFFNRQSAWVQNNETLSRVVGISLTDTSSEARLLTWQTGLKGAAEKPIFGWGAERFYVVFNQYFPAAIYHHANSRVWYDRAHNIYVEYLVQGGVIGLALYLAIFIYALWILWRHYRKSGQPAAFLVFTGLFVAYGIQNAFVFDSINTYILLILTLAAVILIAEDHRQGSRVWFIQNLRSGARTFIGVVIIILVLAAVSLLNIPQLQKNQQYVKNYNKLRAAQTVQDFNQGVADTIKVIDNSVFLGTLELRQSFSEFANDVAMSATAPLEIRRNIIDQAAAQLEKSIALEPDDARHYAFLTNLYLTAANIDSSYAQKNLKIIEKGISLSPTRTPFYYSLGRVYIVLKLYDQAIEAFKKGVELSPKVPDAHLNLLAAYITAKKDAEAVQEIKVIRDLPVNFSVDNYVTFSRVLRAGGYNDAAIAVLLDGVSKYQSEAGLYGELSGVYYALNNEAKALEYAQQAATLDPQYSALVDELKAGKAVQ
ncbi:MAG: O-antigen ligase family protein [Candidatus Komeilibacteria bacterium]